ncbi:MAG: hypothetical protein O9295_01600 [Microcystis sp. LE18-22.4A]|nr:hypothetical protein [Microcystis sp. LE18-22.4A]
MSLEPCAGLQEMILSYSNHPLSPPPPPPVPLTPIPHPPTSPHPTPHTPLPSLITENNESRIYC